MVTVNGFMCYTIKHRIRRRGFWQYYGPLMLTMLATPLVMADLTRHVFNDWNVWNWCGNNVDFPRVNQTWNDGCLWSSTQYHCDVACCVLPEDLAPGVAALEPKDGWPQLDLKPGEACECNDCMVDSGEENPKNLSVIGWIFTIFCTYLGFTLLAVGTMWNANLVKKLKEIRQRWRELRRMGRSAEV